ncbi:hypothetical protein CRM22_011095 [Opisthorchis felineus]|uniref:Phorbol-ester/DAG-type domain-containing protein n=1 Tax=Opisthorchis felineus TaxID=147828 RepID=A0A4S2KFK1_OPIFE|nr:hypothetical protein CRM22_011095 [Opisthorchis felineus]
MAPSTALILGLPSWSKQAVHMPVEVPHTFELHRSAKPAVCQHCHRLLHGLFRQGLQCKDCKLWVHKKCASLVPKNCEGELLTSEEGTCKASDNSTNRPLPVQEQGPRKLRKRLFLRGQTVGTISTPPTPDMGRRNRFENTFVHWRRQNTSGASLNLMYLRKTVDIGTTNAELELLSASLPEEQPFQLDENKRDQTQLTSTAEQRKASFRSQHKEHVSADAPTASAQEPSHNAVSVNYLPTGVMSSEEAPRVVASRTGSIERPPANPRHNSCQNTPRNIPLMRVIQSARHTKRHGTGLIIRESWMVHSTNKDAQLRRHFWRVGAKSITMFYHEKTNRYYKEGEASKDRILLESGFSRAEMFSGNALARLTLCLLYKDHHLGENQERPPSRVGYRTT